MNISKLRRIFVHFQRLQGCRRKSNAGVIAEVKKEAHSELCSYFYNAENGQKDQQGVYILRRKSPNRVVIYCGSTVILYIGFTVR